MLDKEFYFVVSLQYQIKNTNKMKTQNTKHKVDGILISMVIIGVLGTVASLLLVIQCIML